jgi:fructose-1,6-bisphosphatase/inositol monophosphatase family enzyme
VSAGAAGLVDAWRPRLLDLADRMREATLAGVRRAREEGTADALARPVGRGAGDVTYGLDVFAERALDGWLDEIAREGPLSLLSEDAGWRHAGADGFDHGGPRIAVDPIDGTRNLMADLRPAWSVLALAAPGPGEPRLADVVLGVVAEIPDSRAARYRVLCGAAGGACALEERRLEDGALVRARRLDTGDDARADHGYFPFFKYMADQRPAIAAIEAAFLARLAAAEGADVRTCYDDQYISNGGQLALLAQGTYRMVADLRAFLAERRGRPTITTKPYDVAGAIVCARAAGALVEAPDGSELDFPIDVHTPVSWVGWANRATRARLAPHLCAVLERLGPPDAGRATRDPSRPSA